MHSLIIRSRQLVSQVLLCILAMLIVGCSLFNSTTTTTEITSPKAAQYTSPIDTLTASVLMNMHLHGWNPNAMTRGVVTGGLFINWKMDNPSVTNAVRPGPDGNPQHNHDPQVDLMYLTALAEYHLNHPQDHAYDTDLSHMTQVVLADFNKYNLPVGWIYFYLLRSGLILHNTNLIDESHRIASNFYSHWYDSTVGTVYDREHNPGDYSTNHSLQCGAALIDAGQRWKQPDWINAGEKTIDHIIADGLDMHYHLFYGIMTVSNNGQDKVENYQAKPSTEGESVDALVTAYTLTHRQKYLNVADQVLQSLLVTSGLWDESRGGFFFAVDMSSGKLLTAYKETRSQTLTLIGLNHYNQVSNQKFARQEQQLISVIVDHFYQHTYQGFFYRVTPDFQVYVSKPGAGIGIEDYFTTEAMGGVLVALQQTEEPQ